MLNSNIGNNMFSIIMPYYRNTAIVSRSIDSVLSQTFKDFELIIIDDGSEDNILEIVEKYNDDRIILIKQDNTGVSGARNKGISNARNKFICFLDSDDKWLPEHLEILNKNILLFDQEAFFVTGHKRLGGEIFSSIKRLDIGEKESLLVDDYFEFAINKFEIIHTNSVCIKTNVFDKIDMFEEGVNRGEDVDLWFRVAAYFNVVFINKTTTLYYRDFSYLTAELSYEDEDREIFIERRKMLLDDKSISSKKRESIRIYMDRIFIARARKYIAMGNKKQALHKFKDVKYHSSIRRDYIITKTILILPIVITKPIVSRIYLRQIKDY